MQRLLATVIVAVLAFAIIAVLAPSLRTGSVIGGFQGQAYSVYGATFNGVGTAKVGGSFPSAISSSSNNCGDYVSGNLLGSTIGYSCDWTWGSSDIGSPQLELSVHSYVDTSAQLGVSFQTTQPVAECVAGNLITPSGAPDCPTVSLYTRASNGTLVHEYGWIVDYAMGASVSTSGSSSCSVPGPCSLNFQSISWINQLASFYWPNAYADPTNSSWEGSIFQAPLQLYIDGCKTGSTGSPSVNLQDCSANGGPPDNELDPMNAGVQVQLYTNPQITGSWQDLGCSIAGQSLASCATSLQSGIGQSGTISPSQYFSEGTTYFPVTMQLFGDYVCGAAFGLGGSLCNPYVDLHMTLYTILLGTYIPNTTSHITQTLSNNGGGSNVCGTGNFSVLNVCTNVGSLVTFFATLAGILVLVIVLVVFLPTALGRALGAATKRRGP